MEGLNRRFKNHTQQFLRTTPIIESLRHMTHAPAQGVVEFDLEPYQKNAARIGVFAERGKNPTRRSHRIRAYWLPWQPNGTSTIQLGDQADYFFTSQLAGCQIRIVPGPYRFGRTNHPRVLHIAGNVTPAHDPTGASWRNQQAQNNLDHAALGRSRALSSTGGGSRGYQGEGVNVVGFIRLAQWQFWGQQVDFDNITVGRVWQIR